MDKMGRLLCRLSHCLEGGRGKGEEAQWVTICYNQAVWDPREDLPREQ